MFRHIVLIRWLPDASEEQKQAVRNAVAAFPSQVPDIVSFKSGDGLGKTPNSYDFAVTIDFADRAGWKRYIDSAAHRDYASGPGKDAVASLASVQHEW